MRSLYLTFDDEDFDKLKRQKERFETKSEERIKWEDFVFDCVCGK